MLLSGGFYEEEQVLQFDESVELFIAGPKSTCKKTVNYFSSELIDDYMAKGSSGKHQLHTILNVSHH